MWPLLFLSIASIAIIIERALAYRTLAQVSPGLLQETSKLCRQGRFDEALKTCQSKSGPVAACLAKVIELQGSPIEDIERNVQEVGEDHFIRLEKHLPILDTTTTISPLLGLLGTLFGMIGTFQAITAAKNSGANDSILSGVGEALYATATGLTIAVVCFVAYNYFAARQRHATAETEQAATKLINTLRSQVLAP